MQENNDFFQKSSIQNYVLLLYRVKQNNRLVKQQIQEHLHPGNKLLTTSANVTTPA